ncbi:uncharacterized protein LOC110429363 [Herrania umbratica]|uniref:Uncharacterized protein LOC110429363 n=1 Tax=Herrania umbratica TaxID=108875 RepID=A0A6J1BS53_9ROSI|nr:uncharacterized protein LOC110429363 [Herrania umbratica]
MEKSMVVSLCLCIMILLNVVEEAKAQTTGQATCLDKCGLEHCDRPGSFVCQLACQFFYGCPPPDDSPFAPKYNDAVGKYLADHEFSPTQPWPSSSRKNLNN